MPLRIRLAPSVASQPKTPLAQLVFSPSSLSYLSLHTLLLNKRLAQTKLKTRRGVNPLCEVCVPYNAQPSEKHNCSDRSRYSQYDGVILGLGWYGLSV
jgi:hypothetical protein